MKIRIKDDQIHQISSPEDIKTGCEKADVLAFDIYNKTEIIGFVMLRKYSDGGWILWNYALDKNFQGKKLGCEALVTLLKVKKEDYKTTEITTTYNWGNEIAKALYAKVGFIETNIVDEPNCHEVNMILKL